MKIRITKEDAKFSRFIRKRAVERVGGCEHCKKEKHDTTREDGSTRPAYMQLECSHFIGRGNWAVRFDPSNAIGVCFHCHHSVLGANPPYHTEFFKNLLGEEEYDKLNERALKKGKPDMEELNKWLNSKLKEME